MKKWTVADVAKSIGYSRVHLTKEISKGGNSELEKLLEEKHKDILQNDSHEFGNNQVEEEEMPYIKKRLDLKNNKTKDEIMFYEVGANAGTKYNAEILPVNKNDGKLVLSELFKDAHYVIRIAGNSMMTNYSPGMVAGIREIPDKTITPGSVYVVEKDGDLWIKRLFYFNDDQQSGEFQCISDNDMVYDHGPRKGMPYYPAFTIPIDKVRRLFKVTATYKANDITIINH